jgi:hypothetical protein
VHPLGAFRVGLYRDGFRQVVHPAGFQLQPVARSPILWSFSDAHSGLQGRLLNVLGLLDGGVMSIAAAGLVYMLERGGETLGLYLPTVARTVQLPVQGLKEVNPAKTRKPLYPEQWPKAAVSRVIRYRLRSIAILDEAYLLRQFDEPLADDAPGTGTSTGGAPGTGAAPRTAAPGA